MKRWLFREPPAGSPPRGLARELSISPLLLDILWRRGLDSPEELDAYLSARLPDLVPPSRWPQFPQAAEVISKALLDGKKLAVWGDYDVDGITSSHWCWTCWKPTAWKPCGMCPTAAAKATA